ncbi:MAG: metal-dependent transcriptional regulator [Acidimicrobiia bacterium]|nr:metal-dependent transcriptional regulator [Acidimicrobiia bacterium]
MTHVTTEAEEMYLITIAREVEDGLEPPVPVSAVAKRLGVSSVSANQMIKKLEGLALVDYTPYKGVALTDTGDALAKEVLRNRRLWGLFLSEHLGLTPESADEVACEMEHITPDWVADRLSNFLGNPRFGPTGKPIPVDELDDGIPLADAAIGVELRVASVAPPFDAFMASHDAGRGSTISVLAVSGEGAVLVGTPTGTVNLAPDAVAAITVRP